MGEDSRRDATSMQFKHIGRAKPNHQWLDMCNGLFFQSRRERKDGAILRGNKLTRTNVLFMCNAGEYIYLGFCLKRLIYTLVFVLFVGSDRCKSPVRKGMLHPQNSSVLAGWKNQWIGVVSDKWCAGTVRSDRDGDGRHASKGDIWSLHGKLPVSQQTSLKEQHPEHR